MLDGRTKYIMFGLGMLQKIRLVANGYNSKCREQISCYLLNANGLITGYEHLMEGGALSDLDQQQVFTVRIKRKALINSHEKPTFK